jgi:hypothetical protein
MQTLFGFELGNYYRSVPVVFTSPRFWVVREAWLTKRDVLVLFAFIAGHGVLLVLVVVYFLRERR